MKTEYGICFFAAKRQVGTLRKPGSHLLDLLCEVEEGGVRRKVFGPALHGHVPESRALGKHCNLLGACEIQNLGLYVCVRVWRGGVLSEDSDAYKVIECG